jgi:hypothetical protein
MYLHQWQATFFCKFICNKKSTTKSQTMSIKKHLLQHYKEQVNIIEKIEETHILLGMTINLATSLVFFPTKPICIVTFWNHLCNIKNVRKAQLVANAHVMLQHLTCAFTTKCEQVSYKFWTHRQYPKIRGETRLEKNLNNMGTIK